MRLRDLGCERRFERYLDGLAEVMGHADRVGPLRDYCTGLMLPCARKSVEPMAAATAPGRTSAQHQSLLHFVGQGAWSDELVLCKAREMVLPEMERHGPIEAWIIDDTAFPKQGRHSVGVGRQYCGQLGKQENCQAAVSLSIANHHASLPVCYQLYLPQDWAGDAARRRKTGVPADIVFKTKPEIAIDQIPLGRGERIAARCCAGGCGLRQQQPVAHRDQRAERSLCRWRSCRHDGVAAGRQAGGAQENAQKRIDESAAWQEQTRLDQGTRIALPRCAWRTIGWREGSNEQLSSRFARVRVRAANEDVLRDEEWLLIEWPKGEKEPTKYWLSTLPPDIAFERMVNLAQLRWRIERDYQELKQELGLGHFEGRGWRGFHHHATLCIAAYGFLISERETIPPSGPHSVAWRPQLAIPTDYQPRGAAVENAASHPELDRYDAGAADRGARQAATAMSLLHEKKSASRTP